MKYRNEFEKAIFYLDRKVSRAIREFDLISDGDRILVGLSGGKDSLVLLHVLARRRRWRPEKYELVACHVRQDWSKTGRASEEETTPAPGTAAHILNEPDLENLLARECEELGVPFLTVAAEPIPRPEELREKASRCLLCSRRRRHALFRTAVAEGCQTVALAHHKDDVAETMLLNLLWQARCEGIPPRRKFFGGLVTIIRPLVLVGEAELSRACCLRGFPARTCSCPFADHSQRETAARILAFARASGARDAVNNLLSVALKGEKTPGGAGERASEKDSRF